MSRFIGGGGIPADTNPPQPDNGKQWVDTSQSPPELKIYDSATSAWLPADTKVTIVSQTSPTPEVGKIWFEPAQDGTNMYAASSERWEFLKFLPEIPDSAVARYVASDYDGATDEWADAIGSETLTGGSATKTTDSNGNTVVSYTGSSGQEHINSLTVSYDRLVIAFVFQSEHTDNAIFGDKNGGLWSRTLTGGYEWRTGNNALTGGTADSNIHLGFAYAPGFSGDDEFEIDGTVVTSGNGGSEGLANGLMVASNRFDNPEDCQFAEIVIYQNPTESEISDERTRLKNEYAGL